MVSGCCVPRCSERSYGHAFPKDRKLRKQWLHAIRRDHFQPTKHSRVCSKHFKHDDYNEQSWASKEAGVKHHKKLKPGSVPSLFQWSSDQHKVLSSRQLRKLKRDEQSKQDKPEESSGHQEDDVDIIEEVTVETELRDSATEQGPSAADCEPVVKRCVDAGCQTGETRQGLSIQHYKENPRLVQYYTGFDDFDHFMFVFHLLGPAAYELDYGPRANKTCPLQPEDAFLLALIKLRRNMTDIELSDRFAIPEGLVGPVFHTWLNFMYFEFKEWNIKPSDAAEADVRIILDCTEMKIDRPSNPTLQQATYSSYKSANTVKALVGISPSCLVTHVSAGYCGSYSDKVILEASKVLDELSDGDVILADRGFQIEQMCKDRGLILNVPVSMKGKSQLSVADLRKSTYISSRRIHVERVIGLAKTYSILSQKIHQSKVVFASRIIYVCFMLVNLRRKIVS